LELALLRSQHLVAQGHSFVGVALIASCPEQFNGCHDSKRNTLQFVCRTIHFRLRGRRFQSFHGIFPIFLGDNQSPVCKFLIPLLEYARSERSHSADTEIPLGIVYRLTESVIPVSHDSISPVAHQLPGAAKPVAEAYLQDPIQSPTRFFEKPLCKSGAFVLP